VPSPSSGAAPVPPTRHAPGSQAAREGILEDEAYK